MSRPRRDDDMRVADYVLGVMEPNEAAFFERAMRDDPSLAQQVAEWQRRVAYLEEPAARATPQAVMLQRIRDELIATQDESPPLEGPVQAANGPSWLRRLALPAIGLALIGAILWLFIVT